VVGAWSLKALLPATDHIGAIVGDASKDLLRRLRNPSLLPRCVTHGADVFPCVPELAAWHRARELLNHLPLDNTGSIELLCLGSTNAVRHQAEEGCAVLGPQITGTFLLSSYQTCRW